jgi:hypothetical protein
LYQLLIRKLTKCFLTFYIFKKVIILHIQAEQIFLKILNCNVVGVQQKYTSIIVHKELHLQHMEHTNFLFIYQTQMHVVFFWFCRLKYCHKSTRILPYESTLIAVTFKTQTAVIPAASNYLYLMLRCPNI